MTDTDLDPSPDADYEHIRFVSQGVPANRTTEVFDVMSKSRGIRLGQVRWYGPWRQYCFFPDAQTIWNKGCLDDVTSFINGKMWARRQAHQ